MGISTPCKNSLQSYINELTKKISDASNSCFGFFSNTKLWQTKICAMEKILQYDGEGITVDYLNQNHKGWDSGFSSTTKALMNNAIDSHQLSIQQSTYNQNPVNNGYELMSNGLIMGTNIQEATLYSTDTYNNTTATNYAL